MSLINLTVAHGRTIEEARQGLEKAVHQVSVQFGAVIRRVEWALLGGPLASGLKQIVQQAFQKQLP